MLLTRGRPEAGTALVPAGFAGSTGMRAPSEERRIVLSYPASRADRSRAGIHDTARIEHDASQELRRCRRAETVIAAVADQRHAGNQHRLRALAQATWATTCTHAAAREVDRSVLLPDRDAGYAACCDVEPDETHFRVASAESQTSDAVGAKTGTARQEVQSADIHVPAKSQLSASQSFIHTATVL